MISVPSRPFPGVNTSRLGSAVVVNVWDVISARVVRQQ